MNVADFVPEVKSVSEVYEGGAELEHQQRWEHLLATFEAKYGHPATYISRAPGRVNIIGEHIDYSLFSVLPMAVEADVIIAFRPVEGNTVKVRNVLNKYPDREFPVPAEGQGDVEIDASKHEWSNYFKAGYRGVLEYLRRQSLDAAKKPSGLEVLVDGNVPLGSGLSSSAALVCASALAAMCSMGVTSVDKKELVQLCVVSERYVGVNSGGMDQSASVLGEAGKASFISFVPELTASPVAFPKEPEAVFLIANTFVAADKHVTGPVCYNLRVVETTLAAEVMAKMLKLGELPEDSSPLGASLHGFMQLYFAKNPSEESPEKKLEEIAVMAEQLLYKADGYTKEEISEILGIPVDTLIERYMKKFPVRFQKLQLQKRGLHVFREAARVVKTYRLLSESKDGGEEVLKAVGELMNESQTSCRELYECSCPELDELCELARKAGSYGSRLTGAGWGGCSVHLVPKNKVEDVRNAWKAYYDKKELTEEQKGHAVVESKPSAGAVLWEVQKAGSD